MRLLHFLFAPPPTLFSPTLKKTKKNTQKQFSARLTLPTNSTEFYSPSAKRSLIGPKRGKRYGKESSAGALFTLPRCQIRCPNSKERN
ncbi:hypothetical protein JTE90_013870 [Oedothorax gibbosus]|uniref:Ribosomal protein L32 n=1 Tax=Oedothorax gibbosus TaxID=931172 RepID=A0AAV6TT79_9ARAC|nr:hypothetical protein JTE90_013870 [Oedothorax gibbosus]